MRLQKTQSRRYKRLFILMLLFAICAGMFMCRRFIRRCVIATIQRAKGRATVNERVEQYGQAVKKRLSGDFRRIGVDWPPGKMVLIGLKDEERLEVWVSQDGDEYHFLKSYPILKASGKLGPKLKEGDYQVPEGLYRIESLNPNSRFHLSLRVNYPNAFDKKMAAREGRTNLGGDIMIHGSCVSVGCLAMGDPAAEELFVLAAETGVGNISVILSPVDFRFRDYEGDYSKMPNWVPGLHEQIKTELRMISGISHWVVYGCKETPPVVSDSETYLAALQTLELDLHKYQSYQLYCSAISTRMRDWLKQISDPEELRTLFWECVTAWRTGPEVPQSRLQWISPHYESSNDILYRLAEIQTPEAAKVLVDLWGDPKAGWDAGPALCADDAVVRCGKMALPFLKKTKSGKKGRVIKLIESGATSGL